MALHSHRSPLSFLCLSVRPPARPGSLSALVPLPALVLVLVPAPRASERANSPDPGHRACIRTLLAIYEPR